MIEKLLVPLRVYLWVSLSAVLTIHFGTRLASRRFHGETANWWTTTPEGKALNAGKEY